MDTDSENKKRLEGRARACEGLLASQFGQRTTQAGAKAIERLKAMEAVGRERSNLLESSQDDQDLILTQRKKPLWPFWSQHQTNDGRTQPTPYQSWLAIAASMVLLIAGFGYVIANFMNGGGLAFVKSAESGVSILRDGQQIALSPNTKIKAKDILRIQSPASFVLEHEGRLVQIRVQPSTELVFGSSTGKAFASLARGNIDVQVAPMTNRRVVFATPHAEAVVAGTHFGLTAKSTSTWLDVFEGTVELIRETDGRQVLVGPHCRAVAAPGLEMAARPSAERWQTPYIAAVPHN